MIRTIFKPFVLALFWLCIFALPGNVHAQNSAPISGTVLDPTGAVVPKATVEIHNPVSGYDRVTNTDSSGNFAFANVPFNPYHLTVSISGFNTAEQDVDVRSSVPQSVKVSLTLAGSTSTVTVEAAGADLIETTSTEHTDVDRNLFEQLPLESASSSVSSLITLASPGIVADSNGLFHGLGDHAENSFSIDGQSITDQQSKVFSNQIPSDAIQSMEVIEGAPPAEFGDKTSVIVKVTTRSGLGTHQPTGSVRTEYGSFGTSNLSFDLALGGEKWGNFISANGLNTGRFLDGPEFVVMHDKGNQENIFDRVDFKLAGSDTLQLNLGFTRSWFQNPNSYDEQLHPCSPGTNCDPTNSFIVNPITGNPLGPTDQRSQIKTINIAPSWTHLINTSAVYTLGAFVRKDQYNYYPSADPFNDFSPGIQSQTVSQNRSLTNAGVHSDLSYVKGVNNIKVGVMYEQTYLTEDEQLGIVDPNYIANNFVCPSDPTCAILAPYDLTTGGGLFHYHGHTDVKQLALYLQDTITKGSWSFDLGIRGDFYNGLSTARAAEPRLGIAYNIKPTNTVLRVSYARTMETPFNENLVLSSTGCSDPVLNPLLACSTSSPTPLQPGWRNEFHAGLQQAFGKHFVLSGEYIWKYTHLAYDFSILGNTPITYPIEWNNSKIPGFAVRGSIPEFHGFTAFVVLSSVSARFFNPQLAGAGAQPGPAGAVFRIDHDEHIAQTTHIQYQPFKRGPWLGFNWRYDSGLVAGPAPVAADTTTPVDLTGLTGDQQMQAGIFCVGQPLPTLTAPLATCAPSNYGATRVKLPAPGTVNDDKNPPRIQPRSLFDLALGEDNLFNGERYKWSLRVTAINVANKVALYNFISTFSGTHFVTPRSMTAELGFHF
jgi:Carboxypeptidase regulatory-like domain